MNSGPFGPKVPCKEYKSITIIIPNGIQIAMSEQIYFSSKSDQGYPNLHI